MVTPKQKNLSIIYFFPLFLWLFLRRDFFLGDSFIYGDNSQCFYFIKYYLDNIARGVYPVWDPFFAWGRPDNLDMRFMGEFNPFLYIILLLKTFGMSFPLAFISYLFIYYLFGIFGFFLLALRLFRNYQLSVISASLLIFSALGVCFLQQMTILLICVPAVWFFFFLIGFSKNPQRKDFLGITFSSMIMATTYMPFHFLTIFLSFLVVFVAVCFRDISEIIKKWLQFFKTDKWTVFFCVLSLGISLVPSLVWYVESSDKQYVLQMGRDAGHEQHQAAVSPQGINLSSLTSEWSLIEIFSNLDLGNQQFSYVSIFVYLMICLSIINKGGKKQVVLLGTGFLVFLIALADVTPLQPFLYRHVHFFKLFRNYFYFLPLLIPIIILFSVEQLKLFLKIKPKTGVQKFWLIVFLVCVHGTFMIFLYFQENIVWSSYAAVILSFICFTFYFLRNSSLQNPLFFIVFLTAVLIQPLEVTPYFDYQFGQKKGFSLELNKPEFLFVRPIKGEGLNEEHGFHWRTKIMQDMSGFVNEGYWGTYWSHKLHEDSDHGVLMNYVKHKFFIYDKIPELISDISLDQGKIIGGESEKFSILNFNVNSLKLKTNYNSRKFLVYNDSYHTGWNVFVNNKKEKLFRVNTAFKGVWIEKGENIIYFRYGNPYLYGFYWFLIMFFMVFFIYLLWVFRRTKYAY